MTNIPNKMRWFVSVAIVATATSLVFGQADRTPPAFPAPPATRIKVRMPRPAVPGETSERSLRVDSKVNVTLCVTQGTLKVNGWGRSEIRVFVEKGGTFRFNVQQNNAKTGEPALLAVIGSPSPGRYSASAECIWGDEVEIDLPHNATINIKGEETTSKIDSVRKVNIRTIGGDISLKNISEGVDANAGQGDITVEESSGPIKLESTTGNIVVFDAAPSEIGDGFRAKTSSGAISLQSLGYRQVEANSVSGSLIFNGQILNGGSYNLNTSNGSIRLLLPQNTSSKVSALYGFGSFNSELPLKILTEDIGAGHIKRVQGLMGTGEASMTLATNNGSITIKKQ